MFGEVVWWEAKMMDGAFATISPDVLEVLPLFFNLIRRMRSFHKQDKTGLNKNNDLLHSIRAAAHKCF